MRTQPIFALACLGMLVVIPACERSSTAPEQTESVENELQKSEPLRSPLISQASPVPAPSELKEPKLDEADVSTRQRYYDGLIALRPSELIDRALNSSGAGADDTTQSVLLEALTTTLANRAGQPDANLTAKLTRALQDRTSSLDFRAALAQAIADSAALPGVEALLKTIPSLAGESSEVRQAMYTAISSIGSARRDDGTYPVDLSPAVETALLRSLTPTGTEPALLEALAQAVAQIGSQSGTRILLQKMQSDAAIAESIPRIRNPDAIPALIEPFQAATNYSDARMEVSGKALVHIGGEQAVKPVLEWLRKAPADAQPLAATWFSNIREPASFSLIETYVRDGEFSSEAIRKTLERSLEVNSPEDIR